MGSTGIRAEQIGWDRAGQGGRGARSPWFDLRLVDEREQIGIHLVLKRRAQTMRRAVVDLQRRALDELGLKLAGVRERHDLVVAALYDERRNIELLQVLGLIGLGE